MTQPPPQWRPPVPPRGQAPMPPPQRPGPGFHQPPPQRYAPPRRPIRQAPPPAPRNGLGLAAVIIAPIGVLFGLVPLTGWIAVICGLVAVPLAIAGLARARRGEATNRGATITGGVIGVLAVVLGIVGITIVAQTLDQLSGPAPAAIGAPGDPAVPAAASEGPVTAAFGQRITYEDGIAVEVTAPQAYRPGRYSAGHDRDRAVRFEVTITNGGREQVDAVTVIVRGTHGGRDAPTIFDSAGGLMGPPQGVVLPGNSITFPVALSVGAEPGAFQVDVTPGFLSDPAIFTGQV